MDLSGALLNPSAPLRKVQGEQLPPLPGSLCVSNVEQSGQQLSSMFENRFWLNGKHTLQNDIA